MRKKERKSDDHGWIWEPWKNRKGRLNGIHGGGMGNNEMNMVLRVKRLRGEGGQGSKGQPIFCTIIADLELNYALRCHMLLRVGITPTKKVLNLVIAIKCKK